MPNENGRLCNKAEQMAKNKKKKCLITVRKSICSASKEALTNEREEGFNE